MYIFYICLLKKIIIPFIRGFDLFLVFILYEILKEYGEFLNIFKKCKIILSNIMYNANSTIN